MHRRLFFAQQLALGVFIGDVLRGCFRIDLLLNQRRQHPAGANRVAGHARGGCFQGADFGQADQAVLGGHIGRFFSRTDQAMGRCHVDDAAPVGCFHGGQGQACGVESAAQVDGQHGVPFIDGEVFYFCNVLNAGVVHENVDAAELVGGKLHHGFDLSGLAHVGAVVSHLHTQGADRSFGAFDVAKAVEHDIGTASGQ